MKKREGWKWDRGGYVCLICLCMLCMGCSRGLLSPLIVLDPVSHTRETATTLLRSTATVKDQTATGQQLAASELYAYSAVLMDGHSGRILYEKNGHEILPMASTTKIMTCILALEHGNPDEMLTVSSKAASMPQVRLGVHDGERYRLEDLLYSLMLESHNDSAVVIAEGIAGSVEAFADMMNQKARDIGCYDTFFVTPNGLDATAMCQMENGRVEERAHCTTAADLSRILRYCIMESAQREMFLKITQADSHQFMDAEGRRTFGCYNHNAFLDMMEGALTGKTGFTSQAGYCYVGAVEQEGELYIVALLACGWPNHKSYKWADMRKLVAYGLKYYEYRDVWQDIPQIHIPVVDGVPQDGSPDGQAFVTVEIEPNVIDELYLLLREDEQVKVHVDMVDTLEAPIQPGTMAGTVTYYLEDEIVKMYHLVTTESVALRDFRWYLQYIWDVFLLGDC